MWQEKRESWSDARQALYGHVSDVISPIGKRRECKGCMLSSFGQCTQQRPLSLTWTSLPSLTTAADAGASCNSYG
eukprot:scaffold12190_cov115-Amphora_coffeaeformis.AAC.1